MSYFSKYFSHPAMVALASLRNHPAITSNPDAVAAISDAQAAGTVIASVTTSAANQIAAAVAVEADPILGALGHAAQSLVDAYLIATLGPVGTAAVPVANAVIALGEDKVHSLFAALFAHARAAHAEAVATVPADVAPPATPVVVDTATSNPFAAQLPA